MAKDIYISRLGGKGNGLVWLTQNTDLGFSVPEFEVIDTSFYEDILKQRDYAKVVAMLQTKATGQQHISQILRTPKRLEEKCAELAGRFRGREVAVRSSAVGSEDGDKYSGAGIYETFFIDAEELTPKRLQEEVLKVYASVDSERAVQYRRQAGLGEERMAVVVQEAIQGTNGVVMSRLPQRAGIIPITWSGTRGAVVRGDSEARISRIYFAQKGKRDFEDWAFGNIFRSESLSSEDVHAFKKFAILASKLKERYEKEFEAEFVKGYEGQTCLVQIRPLTNVQDKKVKFPKKKAIFKAENCMTVGEYIGPWIMPRDVQEGWEEPQHYAYVAPRLDQSIVDSLRNISMLFGGARNAHLNYDELTPNKRAIVITNGSHPGIHALTIANERGILCLGGRGRHEEDEGNDYVRKMELENRMLAGAFVGMTLVEKVKFDVPLEDVGKYIHIVSDGINGRIYRATEQEAREFAKTITSQIDYDLTPVEAHPMGDKMFDIQFIARPTNTSVLPSLCIDFVRHLEKSSGRRFELDVSPARNSYTVNCRGAEFEVYDAFFDPERKREGVTFSGGRSSDEIADMPTTKKWFEDFRNKLRKGYIPSGE